MTVKQSKVQKGKLSLTPPGGGTAVNFECQASNISIQPDSKTSGNALEVLCGDQLGESKVRIWWLAGTAVQDFDDAEGFIRFSITNDLTDCAFSWTPNATADVISGTVQVEACELGGDVAARLTSTFKWSVTSGPVFTPQTP